MDSPDKNTSKLWQALTTLISLIVLLCISTFIYLPLQSPISDYLSRPSYTEAELLASTKRREKVRRQERNENWDLVENGIHVKTGLRDDKNLQVIISSCTSCHSAKLITQNRATREGWKSMIDWMQETQGLGDLGDNEPIILTYLSEHYAPQEVSRRQGLDLEAIEWYILATE